MARRSISAMVAVAALAACLPAHAVAGGAVGGGASNGVFYFVGNSPLTTTGGIVGRSSICSVPATSAIGGGFDADLATQDGLALQTTPVDAGDEGLKPDDGWFSEALNVTGVNSNMQTWSICGEDQVKYRVVERPIQAGKSASIRVPCPDGTRGTSGGLENPSANRVRMNAMYPIDGADGNTKLDDGFTVRATNIDAGTATVKARAMCVSGVQVEYRVDKVPLTANAPFGVSASGCAADQAATGGGVRAKSSIVDKFTLTAFVPGDIGLDELDSIPDDRFAYEGVNGHPTLGGNVKFFTACLSRP